mgnify:CR=1 FL=1
MLHLNFHLRYLTVGLLNILRQAMTFPFAIINIINSRIMQESEMFLLNLLIFIRRDVVIVMGKAVDKRKKIIAT